MVGDILRSHKSTLIDEYAQENLVVFALSFRETDPPGNLAEALGTGRVVNRSQSSG